MNPAAIPAWTTSHASDTSDQQMNGEYEQRSTPSQPAVASEGTMPSFQPPRLAQNPRQEIIDRSKQHAKSALSAVQQPDGVTEFVPSRPNNTPRPVPSAQAQTHEKQAAHQSPHSTQSVVATRKRARDGSPIVHRVQADAEVKTEPVDEAADKSVSADTRIMQYYLDREALYVAAKTDERRKTEELLRQKEAQAVEFERLMDFRRQHPGVIFGPGYGGFGNPATGSHAGVLYPRDRRRPGRRRAPELRPSRRQMKAQAEHGEELVPIRIEVDHDKIKLRDTFTWNLHDEIITPELFASHLVEDYGLQDHHPEQIAAAVASQIKNQLQEYYPHIYIREEKLDDHLQYFAYKNDDMRCLIRLNITVGSDSLSDQFEWDLNNPENSPEAFAQQMAIDMQFSGEFTTAIAHSIREQIQAFTKGLYVTNHPFDGRPVEDGEIQEALLPSPLVSSFRPFQSAKDFAPYIFTMNETDLERAEEMASREQRRQKRAGRRGGPALPDLKEKQRTTRTLIISSVLPGAALTFEESRVIRRPKGATTRASGRGGRRKDVDDSDESASEQSGDESIPPSTPGLYRGVPRRGAASAANAAMKAIGRSPTPDSMLMSPQEQPSTGKRFGRQPSVDDERARHQIVTLKFESERGRQFLFAVRQLGNQPIRRPPPPHVQMQMQQQQQQTGVPPAYLMQQQMRGPY